MTITSGSGEPEQFARNQIGNNYSYINQINTITKYQKMLGVGEELDLTISLKYSGTPLYSGHHRGIGFWPL